MANRNQAINKFKELAKKLKNEAPSKNLTEESLNWYLQQLKNYRNIGLKKDIIANNPQPKISTGDIVVFEYFPLDQEESGRKRLPYYDAAPLVLVLDEHIEATGGGDDYFLGINLHYVSPEMRAAIFAYILENFYDENTKSLESINYWKLKDLLDYSVLQSMIKAYSYSRDLKLTLIYPHQWTTVLFLPLQRFKAGVDEYGQKRNPVRSRDVWRRNSRKRNIKSSR